MMVLHLCLHQCLPFFKRGFVKAVFSSSALITIQWFHSGYEGVKLADVSAKRTLRITMHQSHSASAVAGYSRWCSGKG